MNCTQEEYHCCWNGGVYRDEPTQEVIEQFAERNNLDIEVAKRYFSHSCEKCNKKIKSKEVIAMNMKLNGRITNKFFCKKHLMEMFNMTKEQWEENVERFKDQGCDLF